MTIDKDLISEEALKEAAFLLLTSSSIERYVRLSKTSFATQELRRALTIGAVTAPMLIERADRLWRQLLQVKQRDLPEVELATILATLAITAVPEVSKLLERISLIDGPSVAWISALARRLLQERPTNQDFKVPTTFLILTPIKRVDSGVTSIGRLSLSLQNFASAREEVLTVAQRN